MKEINAINDDYTKFYQNIGLIGGGQYGKVFKCLNKKSQEERAIKVIDIYNNNEDYLKYIKNEIKTMKLCSDENKNAL